MRSFGLCLSLAFLLCLQVYAQQTQDPIIGTWTNPKIKKNDESNCCVPDSISIVKYGSDYKGTYDYSKWTNPSCVAMFLLSSDRSVDVVKKTSLTDVYGVQVPIFDALPWEGFRIKMLSSSQIEVYNTGNSTVAEASLCDFTLTVPGAASSLPIKYIIIAVVVLLLVLCIICKCRQNKQAVIIQQESGYVQPQYGNQPYVNHQQPQRYI